MGTSATTATNQELALQRNAARASILDAARRLADRGADTSSLSLSAVADEAGFVAATVYGYFRSKEELLLAIAADDLAGLAALMRRARALDKQFDEFIEDDFDDAPELETAVGEKIEASVMNPATPSDGRVEPKLSAPVSESAEPDDKGPSITVVQSNPEPVPSNVVRPDFTDDRPRVDAWLERRLRVFERALADLERRMTEAEARAGNVDQKSDDSVRSVQDRLSVFEDQFNTLRQSLTQRMDESERRQRSLASELRADVNDASGRLDRLETAKPVEMVAPTVASAEPQPAPVEAVAAEPEASAPAVFGRNRSPEQDGYVVAARRAATAAATLAELHAPDAAPEDAEDEKSAWQRFAERRVRLSARQKLVVGSATLLLFVAGGAVAFQAGKSDGRRVAVAAQITLPLPKLTQNAVHHAAHRAVHHAATTYASLPSSATPLDRLSALANAGNPRAELLIGLKYLHGEDVASDPSRAAQWITKAAEGHEPLAQYWLGSLYERGEGVSKDPVQAIKWYEAAAGQGNWKAMHSLGVAYAQGNGVNKDLFEAARWFERAATLGYVNSQFNLAVLYERGDGVPQSLRDAYKWYVVAAAQGDTESRTRVEALKLQLSPADLAEGDREAQAFHPGEADREANIPPAIADLAGSSVGR